MFEPSSAMTSIAEDGEFRFARFYIVCEAVPLGTLGNPLIVCGLSDASCGVSKHGKRHLQVRYDKQAASASVPLICRSSFSVFHLPEGCGVRRERTAAPKVVRLPGEQVNGCATACVEVRREAFGIGVDGD